MRKSLSCWLKSHPENSRYYWRYLCFGLSHMVIVLLVSQPPLCGTELPVDIRTMLSLKTFKSVLKIYPFKFDFTDNDYHSNLLLAFYIYVIWSITAWLLWMVPAKGIIYIIAKIVLYIIYLLDTTSCTKHFDKTIIYKQLKSSRINEVSMYQQMYHGDYVFIVVDSRLWKRLLQIRVLYVWILLEKIYFSS